MTDNNLSKLTKNVLIKNLLVCIKSTIEYYHLDYYFDDLTDFSKNNVMHLSLIDSLRYVLSYQLNGRDIGNEYTFEITCDETNNPPSVCDINNLNISIAIF